MPACTHLQSSSCFILCIVVNSSLQNSLSNLSIVKIIPYSILKCSITVIKTKQKKNLYLLKITQNVREDFEFSIEIPVLCLTFDDPVIDWV